MNMSPHPVVVLLISPVEMDHPVSQGFESVGGQASPDGWDESIEQRLGHIVQFIAHSYLPSQGLQDVGRNNSENK